MVSGNSKFHENFGTGNCDLTIFSIVQQGALQIIGTHRKFKQVRHYKRTCVREAKVIYNIKKATVFVIHQLRNVNWTSNFFKVAVLKYLKMVLKNISGRIFLIVKPKRIYCHGCFPRNLLPWIFQSNYFVELFQVAVFLICKVSWHKQPPRDVPWKNCSGNTRQMYRRTPMPKCEFNKVPLQLYWNHTLTWVFSCKFVAYFQNTFS